MNASLYHPCGSDSQRSLELDPRLSICQRTQGFLYGHKVSTRLTFLVRLALINASCPAVVHNFACCVSVLGSVPGLIEYHTHWEAFYSCVRLKRVIACRKSCNLSSIVADPI